MQRIHGVQGILGIPAPINEPMFSLEERDRRWARLRELMDADGVELLIAGIDHVRLALHRGHGRGDDLSA